jgi:2-methylcitrate dehydratase PrpD
MVQRPAAQALFPKIDMVVTEEGRNPMARNFAEVTLYLRCGRVFSRRVDHARGSPRNPLSDDELVAKFRDAAGAALTPAEADRAIDTLWRLDALDDVRPAIALVAGSPALTRKTVALARD